MTGPFARSSRRQDAHTPNLKFGIWFHGANKKTPAQPKPSGRSFSRRREYGQGVRRSFCLSRSISRFMS